MALLTLVPTENVGSLPRPSCKLPSFILCFVIDPVARLTRLDLQEALKGWDEGTVTEAAVRKAQDRAAEDSVRRMEQTGQAIVTDGEQRVSS